MKKILFLVNHDIVIYNFRKELVECLLQSGYEVIISSPYGERIDFLRQMGCKYIEANINRHGKNPFAEFKLYQYYERIIKKVHPTAVLTFTIKPTIYGAFASDKNKVPCIVNITGLGMGLEEKGLLQKLLVFIYRKSICKAQCVFFQNESNLKFFDKHKIFCKEKFLLPGSGVNINEFSYEKYPDYPKEHTKFLFVGRVMKDKGIDEYLEAAQRIKSIYPLVEFGIIGFLDGKYKEILEENEAKGIVRYYGLQMDVKPFYKASSVIVLPSYHEGMANVLLEAASMGRPVLASNIPGCKETFEEGESGCGFKAKDANDVFEKMKMFIELPWKKKEFL